MGRLRCRGVDIDQSLTDVDEYVWELDATGLVVAYAPYGSSSWAVVVAVEQVDDGIVSYNLIRIAEGLMKALESLPRNTPGWKFVKYMLKKVEEDESPR